MLEKRAKRHKIGFSPARKGEEAASPCMKTRNTSTSARSILESASGENLLMLAILSGRGGRADIESVLERRALGLARGERARAQGKRRATAA